MKRVAMARKKRAHYNLGAALWFDGQRAKAVPELSEAIRYDPAFAQAYLFLGTALKETGAPELALRNLHRAMALSPDVFPARVEEAVVLLKMGRTPEGLTQLDAALEIDPRSAEASQTLKKLFLRFDESSRADQNSLKLHAK
jgi:tetratricopeptide (TPR) repeat protein